MFVIFTSSDIDFECNCHNTFWADVFALKEKLDCVRESSGGRKCRTDWIVEKMLELHSESHGRVDPASPDAPHQSQHIRIDRGRRGNVGEKHETDGREDADRSADQVARLEQTKSVTAESR